MATNTASRSWPTRFANAGNRTREILRRILEEVDAHSQGGIHEDDRILLVMKVV